MTKLATIIRPLDIDALKLDKGAHNPNGTFCIMEATAYIAGEEWSDHPVCVSPVIAAFCRSWNDSLSDEDRNRLLKPYVVKVIGTRTTKADEETRAWLATDWLARVQAPACLRLAGLTDHARALESLARIADAATARAAQPTLDAASAAAWDAASAAAWAAARDVARDAARDAAWDAARDAASAAAWAAARDAAWAAARDAARAAAWDAARDAAWDAARDVAWDALRPVVEELQISALGLLEAMIAVGAEATVHAV